MKWHMYLDINDHAALRLGDVDAGAKGSGNGFVDQCILPDKTDILPLNTFDFYACY